MEYLKKPFPHVIFVVLGFSLLLIAFKLSPTSLAGPGLDLVTLLIFSLGIISLLIVNWFILKLKTTDKIIISTIHFFALLLIFWLMTKPQ